MKIWVTTGRHPCSLRLRCFFHSVHLSREFHSFSTSRHPTRDPDRLVPFRRRSERSFSRTSRTTNTRAIMSLICSDSDTLRPENTETGSFRPCPKSHSLPTTFRVDELDLQKEVMRRVQIFRDDDKRVCSVDFRNDLN